MTLGDVARAIDKLFAVADAALGSGPRGGRGRGGGNAREDLVAGSGPGGAFEARMAGVLVAALREAFDRDSERLEIERQEIESQQRRAEQALRFERLRQATDRQVGQIRATAAVAVLVWMTSAVFAMVRAHALGTPAAVLLGLGWAGLLAALGASFAAYRRVATGLADAPGPVRPADGVAPAGHRAALAAWLALAGFALTALALLVSLIQR